jgi:lambda repressor-like predicted transcriptional regulator
MLKDLEQWAAICKAILMDKVSRRQICRETGLHSQTLTKILKHETPRGYCQSRSDTGA